MEGEVNWEAAYHELKRKVDTVILPLLTKALACVPEDDDEDEDEEETNKEKKREACEEHPYAHDIAPWESNYPLIMRVAYPDEREKLFESAKKKVNAQGDWVGAQSGSVGHRRPQVGMATRRAKEQQKEGKRPRHIRRNRVTSAYQPTVPFPATHCILVGHGYLPQEGDVGSHLCHNPLCVNIEHLVWESASRNNRREYLCNKKKRCSCGLQPPCDFTLHQ